MFVQFLTDTTEWIWARYGGGECFASHLHVRLADGAPLHPRRRRLTCAQCTAAWAMRGAALTAGRKLTMRVVARSADDDLGHFGGLVGSLRAGGGRILTTAFAIGHYRQTLDPGGEYGEYR